MSENARIVTSYGKVYIVELADGRRFSASTRGKKTDYACGDQVDIDVINLEQAVINKALKRKTLLYRSDAWRSKMIAANVTQIVIVVATEPSFSDELISRALIAAEAEGIRPVICLNKCDLPVADTARTPEAKARVKEISIALDSGKHTTTHAQLYKLNATSELIDSPGLQSFGLAHIGVEELPRLMPDMARYLGQCRFHNCRHRQEPGCAIHEAISNNTIAAERLAFLQRLQDELTANAASKY